MQRAKAVRNVLDGQLVGVGVADTAAEDGFNRRVSFFWTRSDFNRKIPANGLGLFNVEYLREISKPDHAPSAVNQPPSAWHVSDCSIRNESPKE